MLKFSKRFRRNDRKKFLIRTNIVFIKFNFVNNYFRRSLSVRINCFLYVQYLNVKAVSYLPII
jgi:hypothetical protein